jgi:hypothetical protein
MPAFSRREFLQAGAGLAGAAALAACGGGKKGASTGSDNEKLTNDPTNGLGIFVGTAQALTGVDQRMTFGIFDKGQPVTGDRSVSVSFAPDVAPPRFGPAQQATFHGDGIPTKPYYETTYRFDHAGNWIVKAHLGARLAANRFTVIDPAQTKVPVPGTPMIKTPTPTVTNAMGVNPLCTRQPAPCAFHQTSLDTALTTGKPTAVLFATPALCSSRTCGPVLEVLSANASTFAGRVQIIHVEIFTDLQGQTRVPAVQAYGLDFEPILFLADAKGTVRERLDGPYDSADLRAAVNRLLTATN